MELDVLSAVDSLQEDPVVWGFHVLTVRPGTSVGSSGTNRRRLPFTDVVFILVTGKAKQRWTQSVRAHTGSPSE